MSEKLWIISGTVCLGLGIPLKQKLLTIALLWLMIGFTIGFVVTTWWLKALLFIVATGVTILHLSKRQSLATGISWLG